MDYKIELESNKDGSKKYYDIYIAKHKPGNKLISPPHVHSYYEINYFQSGSHMYVIDDTEIQVSEGDILIVYPNVIHKTYTSADCSKEFTVSTVLKFTPSFLYPMNFSASDLKHLLLPLKFENKYALIHPDDPLHEKLSQLIKMAINEVSNHESGYELALRGCISLIYTDILRNLSEDEELTAIQTETKKANLDLIYKALAYIDDHYSEQISMQQLSKECNVNYYHFSRLFQQYTGQGFRDYLMKFRLNKATRMLLQTNDSITNIAMDCGFETISYFIKKFQEHTGMTPKNFRKQYFENEEYPDPTKNKAKFLDAPTNEVVDARGKKIEN
ncbi:MAG: AraC family transcriptional regulator [Clostridia bacterium]|nr:AraC family transcriptional regulator [Clostridia bacterium]